MLLTKTDLATISSNTQHSNTTESCNISLQHDPLSASSAGNHRARQPSTRLDNIPRTETEGERAAEPYKLISNRKQYFSYRHNSATTRDSAQEQSTLDPNFQNKKRNTTSLMTLDSLKRRLSNMSSASVQHIYSVLRLSSSDSYRSSTSWRSSWISLASLSRSIKSDQGSPAQKGTSILSKKEQEFWTEIIDESQVMPSFDRRPAYAFVAPSRRSCCDLGRPRDPSCTECGFSGWHVLASMGRLDCGKWDKNKRDKFDNTLLHYAAASGHASRELVCSLVSRGFDICAKNIAGQNFLHTMDTGQLDGQVGIYGLSKYVSLLQYLKDVNFPFSDRDCHGRTILHVFLNENKLFKHATDWHQITIKIVEAISTIFSILQPNLDLSDNQGYVLEDLLANWCDQMPAGEMWSRGGLRLQSLIRSNSVLYGKPLNIKISFRQDLSLATWKFEAWLERLKETSLISWVDIHGDTPLTAVIKKWKDKNEELKLRDIVSQLIESGTEVNMRDRNGNTALAIAVIRGSRPCVGILLNAGALPNSRDYRGIGIIATATARMQRAKTEEKNNCYARIFSCITLLAEYGAVAEPTDYEEWIPAKPKKFLEAGRKYHVSKY